MIRALFAFSVFLLTHSSLQAQVESFLDSLKQQLKTEQNDSLRFRLLDELAWTYKRINVDSALFFGNRSVELAKELDPALLSLAYSTLGVTKQENALEGQGIYELMQSLRLNTTLGNKRGLSSNYNNLGNAYENLGRYDSAIWYYGASIEIKMEMGRKESAASTMGNLGLVYMEIENTEKALSYFKKALSLLDPEGGRVRGIYNNTGLAYAKLGKNDSALIYLKKAITGMDFERNRGRFASTYSNLAESFEDLKMYDSAIHYAEKSLEIRQALGQGLGVTYPAIALAKVYAQLGQNEQAKTYAAYALQIAEKYENPERRGEAMWFLANAETGLENHQRAADLYREYSLLKEQLTGESILKAAEESEARFQNRLKEKENLLLKKEAVSQAQQIEKQRLLIAAAVLIVLLLLAIAIILRKQLKERKRLIRQIETQSRKLKELDLAKTQFFANISHDLRSPLTLILASLDNVLSKEADILDSDSKDLLDLGIKNGKRLLYLADEIMDLTRLEEGKIQLELQYVKIVPYLRLLTKMFSSAADLKSINLIYQSTAEDETVLPIDPHQFEKIIYNLLANAIKFTPENGEIIVSLETSDNQVMIKVADSGQGIASDKIPFIFDRYYQSTTQNAAQVGVGIGLALVRELVELHQGEISAKSDATGTTFLVTLPFQESDWVSQAVVPERSLNVITRNSLWIDLQEEKETFQVPGMATQQEDAKTILIVEDHRELRSYLQSILQKNYRVYLAANGSAALDLLNSQKIDLIITDLMMPYMDGFELVDQLKKDKELKRIPVVVVSARTDQSEKLNLISQGAEEVLSKPFDQEELLIKIERILERTWDSEHQLTKLYGETAQAYEKEVMEKLEKLILSRIDDPHLSVLDLADEMAASERKVYRMIKKISGLTPYELIKEIRWQYLDNYLKSHSIQTATKAASLIGMNNASAFANQYKKRFGRTFQEVLTQKP